MAKRTVRIGEFGVTVEIPERVVERDAARPARA